MNFYQAVDQNKRKSWIIMILFVVFVVAVAYVMAQGLGYDPLSISGFALVIAGATSLGSYYFSDQIVLGISGARPADRKHDFMFYTVTENLCLAAGLPMPKLYVIDDTAMNAFATGRDPQHAALCATTGILSRLDRTELEGVIAHELSHVRNYDTRLMSIVSILVGLVALLGDWFLRITYFGGGKRRNNREGGDSQMIFFVLGIVFAILSPIIATLIQLAISREREYLADASGAALTKYPPGLASALAKLGADREPLEAANKATAHLYIHSPFHLDTPNMKFEGNGAVGFLSGLFSTHPPLADRIKRLKSM
ncbi:MAG TPA: M48 family metallopeptidase [Patescibacteria group bacterium]|nr:M48 family metallopeptidase [Patescibacteria group bacterium]